MRSKCAAVVLALLLAPGVSFAQDDAPLVIQIEGGSVMDHEGTRVEVGPGVYLNDTEAIKLGQAIKGMAEENQALKTQNQALVDAAGGSPKVWLLVAAFALGGAATYGGLKLLGK